MAYHLAPCAAHIGRRLAPGVYAGKGKRAARRCEMLRPLRTSSKNRVRDAETIAQVRRSEADHEAVSARRTAERQDERRRARPDRSAGPRSLSAGACSLARLLAGSPPQLMHIGRRRAPALRERRVRPGVCPERNILLALMRYECVVAHGFRNQASLRNKRSRLGCTRARRVCDKRRVRRGDRRLSGPY